MIDKLMPEPDTTILYVVRHGETVLNKNMCFRGNKDVPLNSNGIKDAYNLKKLFSEIPLSFVISSDRIRATQTADIIHQGKSIPKHKTEVLRALDVGKFSGEPRNKENTDELGKYLNNASEIIPGGESLQNFRDRIDPAIWEAFEMADDAGLPGLVVAHSSIIHELGEMFEGSHTASLVEPGGVVAVSVHSGRITVTPIYRPLKNSDSYGRVDTVS